MPTASPSDVHGVIDTSLDDPEITPFLEDAEFEAEQAIDDYSTELTTTERTQLEKYLAATKIRATKEKGITSQSGESRSLSYEDTMSLTELRVAVDKRDPSGELSQSVLRDTNRYSGSTHR